MIPERGTLRAVRRTERGLTLIELMVSLVLSSILGGVGLLIVSTYFSAERVVTTSYANLNQLLPIGTSFQQYIRSAISPAPTPTTPPNSGTLGQPSPPFGVYKSTGALTTGVKFTASSLTFFTDLHVKTIKTPTHPKTSNKIAKVVATYTPTPRNRSTGSFSVTTTSTATTCPKSASTTTKKCRFNAAAKTAFRVEDVTNGTSATSPIFTYYLATATKPTAITALQKCTKTACDADDIQSVGFNLVVNEDPSVGHAADQETVTYEVSAASQEFNAAVG